MTNASKRNYQKAIDLISAMSIEDKQDLFDDVEEMITREVNDMVWKPDHVSEYREQEVRALNAV